MKRGRREGRRKEEIGLWGEKNYGRLQALYRSYIMKILGPSYVRFSAYTLPILPSI